MDLLGDGFELEGLVVVHLAVEVLDVLQDYHPEFLLYVGLTLLAGLDDLLVVLVVDLALAVDDRSQVLALAWWTMRLGSWFACCLH